MRGITLGIAVACTACGRFGFDAATAVDATPEGVPDVLLGHDEDGDGVADVDDLCPHLVSVQTTPTAIGSAMRAIRNL